jgi:hypothetical protein
MGGILTRLGVLDEAEREALAPSLTPIIRNVAESVVGAMRPAAALTL